MVSPATRNRLLACQGPQSLFAGLSFLADDAEKHKGRNFNDTLIIGGLCADEKDEEIESLCRRIAEIHEFNAIYSTIDLDQKYLKKQISASEYILALLKLIDGPSPNIVATVRNMQYFNDALLNCFRRSEKVVYGDGIGWIDTNSTRFSRPILSSGYVKPDRIASILPIEGEAGAFLDLPITLVSPSHYREIVERASNALRSDFLKVVPLDGTERYSLVCLATLTESKHTKDVATEIDYYLRSIENSGVDRSIRIVIKGHPRERHEQSRLLEERLRSKGYQAYSFPGLAVWPSESLVFLLNFSNLVSLNSSSCASWAILGANLLFSVGASPTLNRSHLADPDRFEFYSFELFLQTVRALLGKIFPLTHSEVKNHFESFKGEWCGVPITVENAAKFFDLIESIEIRSRCSHVSSTSERRSESTPRMGKAPDRIGDILDMDVAIEQKVSLIGEALEECGDSPKTTVVRRVEAMTVRGRRLAFNRRLYCEFSRVPGRLFRVVLRMCRRFQRNDKG